MFTELFEKTSATNSWINRLAEHGITNRLSKFKQSNPGFSGYINKAKEFKDNIAKYMPNDARSVSAKVKDIATEVSGGSKFKDISAEGRKYSRGFAHAISRTFPSSGKPVR